MKIKILKDIKIPNGQYKTGNIINTDLMNEVIRKDCENLYNIFIKARYAEEIKEPINNFRFEYNQINDFIPCLICSVFSKHKDSEDCRNCTLLKNLLEQTNESYTIKSTKEINNKIIELIKTL